MDFNYLQVATELLGARSLQRVKVYRLNLAGKWDDKGTGHVSVEYLERSRSLGMVVLNEEDNGPLLVHRISTEDIYRRQEDTIISWTDPELRTDLALSFQEIVGCAYIWDQIKSVQRTSQFPNSSDSALDNGPRAEELEHSGTSQDDDDVYHDSGNSEVLDLPPIELSSLPQIVKSVADVSLAEKDRVAALIMRDESYLSKLMDLFRICEDMENTEGLLMFFKIVKGLISLNDRQVFDVIFSDAYIMDIVGALEYDPDLPCRQDHRGFLKNQVTYKEAVPIPDMTVVSRIHQTYRVGYIKDVILPRVLDDQTFATLNSMIMANNKAIIYALQGDKVFLDCLFTKLRTPDLSEPTRKELILFLHEFCNLGKNLQPFSRTELFSTLVGRGLFEVMTSALQSEDISVRVSGCDILIVLLNHDPTALRSFLAEQRGHVLFNLLVRGLVTPTEGGLQAQLLELMRMLLDVDTTDRQQVDKNSYLDIFYEKYMDQLVEVLTDACPKTPEEKKRPSTVVTSEILGSICDLMCFCVVHHGYRIKYYIMRKNVVEKVLRLVHRKEKTLVVAAVRFLRTCVGLKDHFYDNYLIKNNLFEPVIQVFLANGNRYNLLNSAVLELIEFVLKAGVKSLTAHLVENYAHKLEVVDYVDTIQQLKRFYEQGLEEPEPSPATRKDDRELDEDEEKYFNTNDGYDEEDAGPPPVIVNGNARTAVPSRLTALVDYADEDDDAPPPLPVNGKENSRPEEPTSPRPQASTSPGSKRKPLSVEPKKLKLEGLKLPDLKRQIVEAVSNSGRKNGEGRRQHHGSPSREDTRQEGQQGQGSGSPSNSGGDDNGEDADSSADKISRGVNQTSRSSPGRERGVAVGCKVHGEAKSLVSSEPSAST